MKISNFKLKIMLVVFLLMFGLVGKTYAQDLTPPQVATDSPSVNYQLPYPGLLPDHPLYFLKAGRDRIMSFFISNPLKKAEFDLLQADKRIASSKLLVQKNKIRLSQSTFSKGENYFESSISLVRDAKSQGMNISEFARKLQDADAKYSQVFDDIENRLNKKDKKKFAVEKNRLINLKKKVSSLVHK